MISSNVCRWGRGSVEINIINVRSDNCDQKLGIKIIFYEELLP